MKRHIADVESRYWKPAGEILAAHVGIQETTTPNPVGPGNKTEINIKIYQVSGEVWGDFIYRDHERIEDLYMDLLPHSFVKAIRDEEGKDINMDHKIKKYKWIIIEARAIGPRPGAGRVRCKVLQHMRSLADESIAAYAGILQHMEEKW